MTGEEGSSEVKGVFGRLSVQIPGELNRQKV